MTDELRGLKPLATLQAFVTAKAVTHKAKSADVIAAVVLRSVLCDEESHPCSGAAQTVTTKTRSTFWPAHNNTG
jgi:hypothetical protein